MQWSKIGSCLVSKSVGVRPYVQMTIGWLSAKDQIIKWKFSVDESLESFRRQLLGIANFLEDQACQMVYFQTKNPNLGKFWRALDLKMLIFLWPFEIFYGHL
jgi:hypothetical protein